MWHFILGLVFWTLAGLTQIAVAEEPEVDVWFADYDELMQMSETDRRDYLSEMREIVTGYEINTHDALGDYRSAMNVFGTLLPEAEAASSTKTSDFCPNKGDRYQRLKGEEFCVGDDRPSAKGQCKDGYDKLSNTNGGRGFTEYQDLCYSKRRSGEGGVELICGKGFYNKCDTSGAQVVCKCFPEQTSAPAAAAAAPSGAAPEKPSPPAVKKPKAAPPASPAPAETPPAKDGPKKPSGSEAKPEKGAEKPAEPKPQDSAKPAPAKPTKPAKPVKPEHEKPGCRAAAPKCEPVTDKTREEFYLQKRACVYAGNISKYRHKKPARGDCDPLTSVDLGEKHKYACTEGVLCNPLVFCVPKIEGGKGYCSKNRGNATAKCDALAPKDNKKCLEDLVKAIPSDAWNGFIKQLKQVCATDRPSAQYHCAECSIMYRRIFALNSRYNKLICKGGEGKAKGKAAPKSTPTAAPPTESAR